jgi:hypothetical protein
VPHECGLLPCRLPLDRDALDRLLSDSVDALSWTALDDLPSLLLCVREVLVQCYGEGSEEGEGVPPEWSVAVGTVLDDAIAACMEGQLLLPVLNSLSALMLHPKLVTKYVVVACAQWVGTYFAPCVCMCVSRSLEKHRVCMCVSWSLGQQLIMRMVSLVCGLPIVSCRESVLRAVCARLPGLIKRFSRPPHAVLQALTAHLCAATQHLVRRGSRASDGEPLVHLLVPALVATTIFKEDESEGGVPHLLALPCVAPTPYPLPPPFALGPPHPSPRPFVMVFLRPFLY